MRANFLFSSFSEVPSVLGAALELQTVLQYAVYVVAIILVTVVATLWVASSRVTLRQSDSRPDERRRRSSLGDKDKSGGKRRRRRHRRRNPTLAETGGLPPIRTESSAAATERSDH